MIPKGPCLVPRVVEGFSAMFDSSVRSWGCHMESEQTSKHWIVNGFRMTRLRALGFEGAAGSFSGHRDMVLECEHAVSLLQVSRFRV